MMTLLTIMVVGLTVANIGILAIFIKLYTEVLKIKHIDKIGAVTSPALPATTLDWTAEARFKAATENHPKPERIDYAYPLIVFTQNYPQFVQFVQETFPYVPIRPCYFIWVGQNEEAQRHVWSVARNCLCVAPYGLTPIQVTTIKRREMIRVNICQSLTSQW